MEFGILFDSNQRKFSTEVNHWIVSVTLDNLRIALRERVIGFVESKRSRVKAFQLGDLIIFYVPRESLAYYKRIGKFIGLAEIKGESYESHTPIWKNGLFPQRIAIEPLSERSCEIAPLIERLGFIKNKRSWGITFLGGILRIPQTDFETIRESMK